MGTLVGAVCGLIGLVMTGAKLEIDVDKAFWAGTFQGNFDGPVQLIARDRGAVFRFSPDAER
ncbi:MAG TPA: hypothetical protein VHW69_10045, partial [Rhizomicrobium sp.]|nr:hypothetical protein [Rhizomicrobium sp.]